jgi:hypothetical protein
MAHFGTGKVCEIPPRATAASAHNAGLKIREKSLAIDRANTSQTSGVRRMAPGLANQGLRIFQAGSTGLAFKMTLD